jgi:nucleoside-diphosphate-sugar epimerase
MRILVTGSAGHLGEALMRTLPAAGHDPVGVDINPSPFTHHVGSIAEREMVKRCMRGVDAVVHTATLHKPHVATHSRQDFVDTNVTGTLNLLEPPWRACRRSSTPARRARSGARWCRRRVRPPRGSPRT